MMAEIISLAERRAAKAAAKPQSEQDTILSLIDQIAANLGIDVGAPFRRQPVERAGEP